MGLSDSNTTPGYQLFSALPWIVAITDMKTTRQAKKLNNYSFIFVIEKMSINFMMSMFWSIIVKINLKCCFYYKIKNK